MEGTQSIYSEKASRLVAGYGMMKSDMDLTDLLSQFIQLVDTASWHSIAVAREITQARGRGRGVYGSVSTDLMESTPEVNKDMEELSVEFITMALNNYLDKYQEMPDLERRDGITRLNRIKILIMQVITTNAINLLPELHIPPYIQPMVDASLKFLTELSESAFVDLLTKFQEFDNSHLIPYVESIGTAIFGADTDTDSDDTWWKYMRPYSTSIHNINELYSAYKECRARFFDSAKTVKQRDLYPIFEITNSIFSKQQKELYDEFKENYMNDLNSQYLKNLINGTED